MAPAGEAAAVTSADGLIACRSTAARSWRKVRDSNSRCRCRHAGFQVRCNRPLCQPSAWRPALETRRPGPHVSILTLPAERRYQRVETSGVSVSLTHRHGPHPGHLGGSMEPSFRPVMTPGAQPPLPMRAGAGARARAWSRAACCATPTGCSRCRCCRRSPARSSACRSTSSRLFKAAPIMAPLLMFGVMLGSLFVVTALRNSAWGVVALLGFTFIAGRDADADPDGRRGLPQRRAAGRAGRRHDGGDLLRHGDDRHGVEAGFLVPREVPVRRA